MQRSRYYVSSFVASGTYAVDLDESNTHALAMFDGVVSPSYAHASTPMTRPTYFCIGQIHISPEPDTVYIRTPMSFFSSVGVVAGFSHTELRAIRAFNGGALGEPASSYRVLTLSFQDGTPTTDIVRIREPRYELPVNTLIIAPVPPGMGDIAFAATEAAPSRTDKHARYAWAVCSIYSYAVQQLLRTVPVYNVNNTDDVIEKLGLLYSIIAGLPKGMMEFGPSAISGVRTTLTFDESLRKHVTVNLDGLCVLHPQLRSLVGNLDINTLEPITITDGTLEYDVPGSPNLPAAFLMVLNGYPSDEELAQTQNSKLLYMGRIRAILNWLRTSMPGEMRDHRDVYAEIYSEYTMRLRTYIAYAKRDSSNE